MPSSFGQTVGGVVLGEMYEVLAVHCHLDLTFLGKKRGSRFELSDKIVLRFQARGGLLPLSPMCAASSSGATGWMVLLRWLFDGKASQEISFQSQCVSAKAKMARVVSTVL